MSQLNYIYTFLGKDFNEQIKYPGERILYKNENIKYEDSNENKHYETNVFYTNFRILCLSGKVAIDIPYTCILNHSTKSPLFSGRKYIYLEFNQNIDFRRSCPMYLRENFSPEEISRAGFSFPKYGMIKFSDKHADMDKSYQFLQTAMKAKEYEMSYKPKPQPNQMGGGGNANFMPQQPKVTGLGMDRVKNMMRGKLENQKQMIAGAFTDINSLRQNAEQMIAIASQIRNKIANNQANKSENEEINQVLSKIGFVDPITKEVAGSEYYVKLGEQINNFFMDYFRKNPKTKALTLIDAYCLYNRARTGNTISPKDMRQAIKQLTDGKVMHDIIIKNFNNEMIVIQTPEFSGKNILAMIKKFMEEKKQHYIEMADLSNILHVDNVLLEKTIIDDLLNSGFILIDESDLEVRYYLNIILPYQLK
jgi:hypothetical protein